MSRSRRRKAGAARSGLQRLLSSDRCPEIRNNRGNSFNSSPHLWLHPCRGSGSVFRSDLEILPAGQFMQAALPFASAEAGFLLGQAIGELAGAVPVSDRHVALFPERMVGEVVAGQVLVNVPVGPIQNRVDFVASCSAARRNSSPRGSGSDSAAGRKSSRRRPDPSARGSSARPCSPGCRPPDPRAPPPSVSRAGPPARRLSGAACRSAGRDPARGSNGRQSGRFPERDSRCRRRRPESSGAARPPYGAGPPIARRSWWRAPKSPGTDRPPTRRVRARRHWRDGGWRPPGKKSRS